MLKIIILLSLSFLINLSVFGQYYTETQLQTIIDAKSGAEGDFYIDTLNNKYFMGTTNGVLIPVSADSTNIADVISKSLVDDNSMSDNTNLRAPSQRSVKAYVDSVAGVQKLVENELFFEGKNHADAQYHQYYYVSMKVDDGYTVIRYNRNDVNDDSKASIETGNQPLTLNDVVGLTYN